MIHSSLPPALETRLSSIRDGAQSSRRPQRGSSAGKAFELFDALASGVVKHRHVALFEGEVAAVVLLDGDVLQTISATATYSKLLATKKPRRRAS